VLCNVDAPPAASPPGKVRSAAAHAVSLLNVSLLSMSHAGVVDCPP